MCVEQYAVHKYHFYCHYFVFILHNKCNYCVCVYGVLVWALVGIVVCNH